MVAEVREPEFENPFWIHGGLQPAGGQYSTRLKRQSVCFTESAIISRASIPQKEIRFSSSALIHMHSRLQGIR